MLSLCLSGSRVRYSIRCMKRRKACHWDYCSNIPQEKRFVTKKSEQFLYKSRKGSI